MLELFKITIFDILLYFSISRFTFLHVFSKNKYLYKLLYRAIQSEMFSLLVYLPKFKICIYLSRYIRKFSEMLKYLWKCTSFTKDSIKDI